MGKKRLEKIRENYAERKEQKKTMKQLKMEESADKFEYLTKLEMAKQDS